MFLLLGRGRVYFLLFGRRGALFCYLGGPGRWHVFVLAVWAGGPGYLFAVWAGVCCCLGGGVIFCCLGGGREFTHLQVCLVGL